MQGESPISQAKGQIISTISKVILLAFCILTVLLRAVFHYERIKVNVFGKINERERCC